MLESKNQSSTRPSKRILLWSPQPPSSLPFLPFSCLRIERLKGGHVSTLKNCHHSQMSSAKLLSLSLSCSFPLSLYPFDTSPGGLWPFSSSSTHSHKDTHIIFMIYCHLLLRMCLYACMRVNVCTHVWSVCMVAATSNTLKQHSWDITPSILISPWWFQYRKKVHISKPEKINK